MSHKYSECWCFLILISDVILRDCLLKDLINLLKEPTHYYAIGGFTPIEVFINILYRIHVLTNLVISEVSYVSIIHPSAIQNVSASIEAPQISHI